MAAATSASAAQLSFTLDDNHSTSMITDVVLTDIVGGVNMSFTINDPSRTPANDGDIIAVYFDILSPFTYASLTIANTGAVTGSAGNTRNVQGGNIGQYFDVGVAIGSTGEGHGDVWASFNFDVLGTGLDISDFFGQTFAARGQSLGDNGDSAKQYGTAGNEPDDPGVGINPVPLPAGLPLLLGAMGVFGVVARRRKAA
ncbi:MAG: VPLPA-CTERM sorting domain-containing protein [Pseudooceanicola sp.]|nr:VPLPA-CTERM sorting domain-containing protein [Pseudooceanicola sp.]